MLAHAGSLLRGSWRYASGLRGFLGSTLDLQQAEVLFRRQFAGRTEAFLKILERGVYGNPTSPYRRLMAHAGLGLDDVRRLVLDHGLEGAMARLHDAGVYVTLEEFKGRAPITRPGLQFAVTASDFDNPLLTAHYAASSGGSRGIATRVPLDFAFTTYESVDFSLALEAIGVVQRPSIVWSAGPPAALGLKWVLLLTKSGNRQVTWLSPTQPALNRQGVQGRFLMAYTSLASRVLRRSVPQPRFVPEAGEVARCVADAVSQRQPLLVVCGPSQWVRVCKAAEEAGLDIGGTVFWGGGEPCTEGKAAVLARAGARGVPGYAMAECGYITHGCGSPAVSDDMHILEDKLLVLPRRLERGPGQVVQGLYLTSLLTSVPKLMLNVESGDYGVIEERDCGCLWQRLGLTKHLHHVRSYEKLTSEGVMFMDSMLHELLEETLPARFGGGPIDYQLVEEEEDGLPRVSIVASPRLGPLDEDALRETVLGAMGFEDWSRRMASTWREAGTLRVQRREPYTTGAGKILPLHVLGAASRKEGGEP